MKVYGYKYDEYLEKRKSIQLERCVIRDYIYIIECSGLYLENKRFVSMLDIENYSYVGKMLGIDVYIESILLKGL